MEVISFNENNGVNNYYVVQAVNGRSYVAMHIVNGKFAVYDYEFHDVISAFVWNPNNGFACTVLRKQHLDTFPDLAAVFEIDRVLYMHALIKQYCLKETGEVIHHINGRMRDNRKENLIWVSANQHRALYKEVGKLHKPPFELREIAQVLPEFCKWINAKKLFRMEGHPVCFAAVERGELKHKYIESLKGKQSLQDKFADFMAKYAEIMAKPFGGQRNYGEYVEFKRLLETQWKEIVHCAGRVAIANLDICA